MMKKGLLYLNAFQVASLRIIFAGIVLLPWAIRYIRKVSVNKLGIIFMSGVLGSLLPAYLFCVAEMGIDGALAGTLNSLTQIFVIITGALFFNSKTSFRLSQIFWIIGILLIFCFFSATRFILYGGFFRPVSAISFGMHDYPRIFLYADSSFEFFACVYFFASLTHQIVKAAFAFNKSK